MDVFEVEPANRSARPEADAILTRHPNLSVGIVTADCVPILVATDDGRVVAAIHAGWRGLAAGVIEAGLGAVRACAPDADLVAAVGPSARGCCYEVDDPVRLALEVPYAEGLRESLVPGRADRFQLDLPRLATHVLERAGLPGDRIGVQNRVCTICDADRFESFRRAGPGAGRLTHFITCPGAPLGEG